jgi:hypothetical protein
MPGSSPESTRITYEICMLEALREKIRCKEIWVVGANRYRNPDEDLPADFEEQRIPYYEALKLPLDADRYIADLQAEMRQALHTLDAGMPDRLVRFSGRKPAGSRSRRSSLSPRHRIWPPSRRRSPPPGP